TWQCGQNTCTVTGPWPTPGVGACHALALEVGVITAYGYAAAQLNTVQLTQCNAGVAASTPAASSTTTTAPTSDTIAVATPELSAVGGAVHLRPADIPPVALTTPELSATGGAVHTLPPDIPPVAITTPEVSAIGR